MEGNYGCRRVREGMRRGRERESRKTAQDKELSIITGPERNQSREREAAAAEGERD